ncbi:MAG: hypothetical protein WD988_02965 [Candidatus Curtissbacteria bacterium]
MVQGSNPCAPTNILPLLLTGEFLVEYMNMTYDPDDHTIPQVPTVDDTGTDESQFEEPTAAPSVAGEENPMSGDATNSEAVDIDEERAKVGLDDTEGSLNIDEQLEDEVV